MYNRLILILFVFLSACQADDNISRDYECNFIFDTFLHPLPCQLTGILGNNGHFAKIETSYVQGIRYIRTTRNFDNSTEDIRISTERESQLHYALGANNCIIVGVSSYDNRLVAYDGQCANCLNEYSGRNYPLTWQNGGQQLYCAKCNRTYDVNNGVVASGEGGRELLRYQAGYDGQILRVWN